MTKKEAHRRLFPLVFTTGALTITLLLIPLPANSQCNIQYNVNMYGHPIPAININLAAPSLLNYLNTATSIWNDCSNYGASMAQGIPGFTINSSSSPGPSYTIFLSSVPHGGTACASIQGDLITVYPSNSENPNCNYNGGYASVIAHELGHLLGLTEQTSPACSGFLMSQPWSGVNFPTQVSAVECIAADAAVETLAEWEAENGEDPPPEPIVPPPYSPLVFDLDRGGFRFTSAADGVEFDINADGTPDMIAWTDADYGDGFLVLDRNWDGLINDGSELFGEITIQLPSEEPNGFEALAVYDVPGFGGNNDGLITPEDQIFVFLQLWLDANHDGVSQMSELYLLEEFEVEEISLDYIESRRKDRYKNELRYKGFFKYGGRTGQITDVFFKVANPE